MYLLPLIPIILSPLTTYAQDYFPPKPTGLTLLQSKLYPGVSISYKETHVCETTPGVTSYSGYVHLPPSLLREADGISPAYNVNTFFWFVPARQSPESAPLSIWLDGGPGLSSLVGATYQNGPCYINSDDNSTTLNPWSFNNHVNMLYIDQPNQVGYSYDRLVNATVDLLTGSVTPQSFKNGPPFKPNVTSIFGTVPSQDLTHTANNSVIAAKTLWHFAQAWFREFPEYKPENNKISLWSNSYGGIWGPATFAYFESQNKKIECGEIKPSDAEYLHLDTLGLTNACVDYEAMFNSYLSYGYNNTYGLQMIPKKQAQQIQKGPCLGLIDRCRTLAAAGDPDFNGNNNTVNAACTDANNACLEVLAIPQIAGRSPFDISHTIPDPLSTASTPAFFNQPWVQKELGVPLNFTEDLNFLISIYLVPTPGIKQTSDGARTGLEHLQYVLDNNIKVAMVYGDRDHRCNWVGAENVSLSVPYHDQKKFQQAGYAKLMTNNTYQGGVTRQYGGFSFSRVFDAGHSVGYYQPETVYNIFMRAMFNKDVATGQNSVPEGSTYSTKGPSSSWSIKNTLPPPPPVVCNIWSAGSSCTDNQLQALKKGSAVIKNDVVISPKK